jgi:hypothetical protein
LRGGSRVELGEVGTSPVVVRLGSLSCFIVCVMIEPASRRCNLLLWERHEIIQCIGSSVSDRLACSSVINWLL